MEENQKPIKASWKKLNLHKLKGINLSDWLSIIALSFALYSFLRSCSQDAKIQKMQYSIDQIEHRPNIKIALLKIHDLKMIPKDSIHKVNRTDLNDTSFVKDIETTLEFTMDIYYTNVGNSIAKLYSEFYTDTTSGDDFLRKKMSDLPGRVSFSNEIIDYYTISEINPNDTIVLKRRLKIQHIKDKMFTLHTLIFYKNELNQLFDSYTWTRIKVGEVMMRMVLIPEKNIIVTEAIKSDLEQMIKFVDANYSSISYDESQANKLDESFERLLNLRKYINKN